MKLRDGWNFHNDIGRELEDIARNFYGDNDRPINKIYDADSIECGYFALAMIHLILSKRECYLSKKDEEFINKCYKYINKGASEIENKEADKLITEFKKIF